MKTLISFPGQLTTVGLLSTVELMQFELLWLERLFKSNKFVGPLRIY